MIMLVDINPRNTSLNISNNQNVLGFRSFRNIPGVKQITTATNMNPSNVTGRLISIFFVYIKSVIVLLDKYHFLLF